MIYLDFTPSELERLSEFHKQHPNNTLRVYSDEIIDSTKKTYKKIVKDFVGNSTDIADQTYE